jgi:hypothetical protein
VTDVQTMVARPATERRTSRPRRSAPHRARRIDVREWCWAGSGLFASCAVGVVLGWSSGRLVALALVGALVCRLAHGAASVVRAAAVGLGLLAAALALTSVLLPSVSWSLTWLSAPLLLAGATVLSVIRRRSGRRPADEPALVAGVELIASVVSLVWAVLIQRQVLGSPPLVLLLGLEDNASWVNTLATLTDVHGQVVTHARSFDIFGPVTTPFMGLVRVASVPAGISPSTAISRAVLSGQVLPVVLAPLVATLAVGAALRRGRVVVALSAWFCATVLTAAACIALVQNASLSGALTTLLLLIACVAAGAGPTVPHQPGEALAWCAAPLLIFAAAASWIGILPLGALALAVWSAVPIWHVLLRRRERPGPGFLVVLTVPPILALLLVVQYLHVSGPVGGGGGLLVQTGGTPTATAPVLVAIVVLLAIQVWSARPGRWRGSASSPAAWLTGYIVVVALTDVVTSGTLHYGSFKLTFVLSGVAMVLLVADLTGRTAVLRGRAVPSLAVVAGVLVAASLVHGPVGPQALSALPTPSAPPIWATPVQAEVATGARVVCLSTAPARPGSLGSFSPYACSRWASSLGGLDGDAATTWRFVLLGRIPVSDAVNVLQTTPGPRWTVVVYGRISRLCSPSAWWAPLVDDPHVRLVSAASTDRAGRPLPLSCRRTR